MEQALSEGLGAEFVPNSVGYKVAFVEGKSRCGSGSGTMKVYGVSYASHLPRYFSVLTWSIQWASNGKLERSAMKE